MPPFEDAPSQTRALAPAPRYVGTSRLLRPSGSYSRLNTPRSSSASVYDTNATPLPTPPFVFESSRASSWASAQSEPQQQARDMDRAQQRRPHERSFSDAPASGSGRSTPSSTPRRRDVPRLSPIDVGKAQRVGRNLSNDVMLVSGSSSEDEGARGVLGNTTSPPLLAGLPPLPLLAFKKPKDRAKGKAERVGDVQPAEEWASIETGHRYPSWVESGHKPLPTKRPEQSRPSGYRSVSDPAHMGSKVRRSIHDGTVLHDILNTPSWGLVMSDRQQVSPREQPDVPSIPLHHRPSRMQLLGSTASLNSYASTYSKGSLAPGNQKIKRKPPKRDSVFDRASALLHARRLRYATGVPDDSHLGSAPSPVELRGLEEYQKREAKRVVDLTDLGEYERKYGMYDRKERQSERQMGQPFQQETSGRGCGLLTVWSAKKQRQHEAAMSKQETARQRKRRKMVYAGIVATLFLAIVAIAVATTLLSRKSNTSTAVAATMSSTSAATGTTLIAPASSSTTIPTATAYTLSSCLSLFASSAPAAPLAYPCEACSPILASTTNDFVAGGANTGVVSVLQFCGLRDLYVAAGGSSGSATTSAAASSASNIPSGWMSGTNVCSGWSGIACDELARVTSLSMTYPAVPSSIPASIGNFVALKSLKIIGNSAMPSGVIPAKTFSATNLSIIDIEATSLTGLAADSFNGLTNLVSMSLINNAKLGPSLPTLQSSGKLLTLVVTGQALTGDPFASLPSSLTYLDLSYNSLSGTIPDLTRFNALSSLYLTNDAYAALPASFPSTLQALALSANAKLSGNLPSELCSSTMLSSCDLRGTSLSSANIGNVTVTAIATRTITTGTSVFFGTSTTMSISTGAAPACGACRFE